MVAIAVFDATLSEKYHRIVTLLMFTEQSSEQIKGTVCSASLSAPYMYCEESPGLNIYILNLRTETRMRRLV